MVSMDVTEFPSLISLIVSVDSKFPSGINLMVSMDVTEFPSLISLIVSVDSKFPS